ncbi:hypothetical protein PMAYCL1PPCAC_11095, partial [Pristionchus mayeri]
VFTAVCLPFSAYCLWRFLFGRKRVNVLVACADDHLRNAITLRISDDGRGSDGDWPVRLTGGVMYKSRFGWEEYCFLELASFPHRFPDFCERTNVIIFVIDSSQSVEDQKDSLELFQPVVNYEALKS